MIILGLDPGSRYTGYGLLEAEGDSLRALAHGRFSLPAAKPLPTRLAILTGEMGALIERWQPDIAVLETPFHGLNTKSLVVLAQARGALLAALGVSAIEVDEYTPAEIKSAVTGNGRAEKEQVARMVALQLSLTVESLTTDAADALAVAICYSLRRRLDRLAKPLV